MSCAPGVAAGPPGRAVPHGAAGRGALPEQATRRVHQRNAVHTVFDQGAQSLLAVLALLLGALAFGDIALDRKETVDLPLFPDDRVGGGLDGQQAPILGAVNDLAARRLPGQDSAPKL